MKMNFKKTTLLSKEEVNQALINEDGECLMNTYSNSKAIVLAREADNLLEEYKTYIYLAEHIESIRDSSENLKEDSDLQASMISLANSMDVLVNERKELLGSDYDAFEKANKWLILVGAHRVIKTSIEYANTNEELFECLMTQVSLLEITKDSEFVLDALTEIITKATSPAIVKTTLMYLMRINVEINQSEPLVSIFQTYSKS